jgi:hypothetical protein
MGRARAIGSIAVGLSAAVLCGLWGCAAPPSVPVSMSVPSSAPLAYEDAVHDLLNRLNVARTTGDDQALRQIVAYVEPSIYARAYDRMLLAQRKFEAANLRAGWVPEKDRKEWERARQDRNEAANTLGRMTKPPLNEWFDADGGRFRFTYGPQKALRLERTDPPVEQQTLGIVAMQILTDATDEARRLMDEGRFESWEEVVRFVVQRAMLLRQQRDRVTEM